MSHHSTFSDHILTWFQHAGRHDLPWQHHADPYPVWVSEIMLQQTQVSTVIPYYQRFMAAFPDVVSLANASQDQVLPYWSGLGYYARIRNLHKAAQFIQHDLQGKFPDNLADWVALPGIGRSTAGAILALSMGQRQVILDGNVKRILCRYHAIDQVVSLKLTENKLWQLAEQHTPQQRVADYTQAMMDLGATLCRRHRPACIVCPLKQDCMAYRQGNPEAYPVTLKRKKLPTKSTYMLIIYNDKQQLLLQKRPQQGIWGGLWSFIESDQAEWQASLPDTWSVVEVKMGKQMKHTFTHFHVNIQPVYIQIQTDGSELADTAWYTREQALQLGLPKPVTHLLTGLSEAF